MMLSWPITRPAVLLFALMSLLAGCSTAPIAASDFSASPAFRSMECHSFWSSRPCYFVSDNRQFSLVYPQNWGAVSFESSSDVQLVESKGYVRIYISVLQSGTEAQNDAMSLTERVIENNVVAFWWIDPQSLTVVEHPEMLSFRDYDVVRAVFEGQHGIHPAVMDGFPPGITADDAVIVNEPVEGTLERIELRVIVHNDLVVLIWMSDGPEALLREQEAIVDSFRFISE